MIQRYQNRTRSRTHNRTRGGYSLLELVVVAILAAVLIGLVGRWVGQLGQVALQQATSGLQAEAVVAADRLEDDLTAAVLCTGTDTAIRDISPSRLDLYVAGDGSSVVLVRWEVNPLTGILTRAVVSASDGCSFPEPGQGNFVIDSVATGSAEAPLFVPVSDATSLPDAELYGTCATTDLPRCRVFAVEVNLTVIDGGTPVLSQQVLRVGA